MIGKHAAIKGFALFIILIILQLPCWNTFSNSESDFLVVVGILSAILTLGIVWIMYKYEKELLNLFFPGKDKIDKPSS